MKPRERILARLALGEPMRPGQAIDASDLVPHGGDGRDVALVLLGALLALDSGTQALQHAVGEARLAGITDDEIVWCAVSLMPALGGARASAVAPHLALALGFDLDAALEER